jgi:hypothetical protein
MGAEHLERYRERLFHMSAEERQQHEAVLAARRAQRESRRAEWLAGNVWGETPAEEAARLMLMAQFPDPTEQEIERRLQRCIRLGGGVNSGRRLTRAERYQLLAAILKLFLGTCKWECDIIQILRRCEKEWGVRISTTFHPLENLIRLFVPQLRDTPEQCKSADRQASRDAKALRYTIQAGITPDQLPSFLTQPGNGLGACARRFVQLRVEQESIMSEKHLEEYLNGSCRNRTPKPSADLDASLDDDFDDVSRQFLNEYLAGLDEGDETKRPSPQTSRRPTNLKTKSTGKKPTSKAATKPIRGRK